MAGELTRKMTKMKTSRAAAGISALAVSLVLASCSDGSTAKVVDNYTPPATFTDAADTQDLGKLDTSSPEKVEQDPETIEKREILRDSESYQYLSTPNYIEPSARYYVDSAEGLASCSFGWFVQEKGNRDATYNLTAGHCGNPGDKVYMDPSGTEDPRQFIGVGEFVWQAFDSESSAMNGGDDYALIQFYPELVDEDVMTGTPNFQIFGKQGELELAGWEDSTWLEKNKPYMCRLGWRSGITCGEYQKMVDDTNVAFDGITDHGDSGGVIWAFDPADSSMHTIQAVAITSWVNFAEDAATTNGKTIDKVMTGMDLGVLA